MSMSPKFSNKIKDKLKIDIVQSIIDNNVDKKNQKDEAFLLNYYEKFKEIMNIDLKNIFDKYKEDINTNKINKRFKTKNK